MPLFDELARCEPSLAGRPPPSWAKSGDTRQRLYIPNAVPIADDDRQGSQATFNRGRLLRGLGAPRPMVERCRNQSRMVRNRSVSVVLMSDEFALGTEQLAFGADVPLPPVGRAVPHVARATPHVGRGAPYSEGTVPNVGGPAPSALPGRLQPFRRAPRHMSPAARSALYRRLRRFRWSHRSACSTSRGAGHTPRTSTTAERPVAGPPKRGAAKHSPALRLGRPRPTTATC